MSQLSREPTGKTLIVIERITGVITGHYAINGEQQGPVDYADNIGYFGVCNMPEGYQSNVDLGRPSGDHWPRPLRVRPIPNGVDFSGARVNGVILWNRFEYPDFGPCVQGGFQ